MSSLFLYINLYTCLVLVGLIWVIQVVHYPSFHFIERVNFQDFIAFHGLRISVVVIPLMLLELASAIAVLFSLKGQFTSLLVLAIILLILIWGITFLVSSPIHGELLNGYNKQLVNKLVSTNWWRTGLWTLRSLILIYILWKV